MRILVLCERLREKEAGGITRFLQYVIPQLIRRGHQIKILAARRLRNWRSSSSESFLGMKVDYPLNLSIPLVPYSQFYFTFWRKREIERKIKAFRPDVVFANNVFNAYSAIEACLKYHVPIVTHPHGYLTKEFKDEIKMKHKIFSKIVLKRMEKVHKKAMVKSDLVIALSRRQGSFLRKVGAKKIYVTPNGVDTQRFKPDTPAKFHHHPSIGYCGRMLPSPKGVEMLMKAMKKVSQVIHEAKLFLVGDFPDPYWSRKRWENLAENYELNQKVVFVGSVSMKEMPSIYASFDIYCQLDAPTFGTPLAMLEAAASGVPVITCDYPERREFFSGSFLFVPYNDPEATAQAIIRLLKNKDLRENLAQKGLKNVKKFDWINIASQIEKALISVLYRKSMLQP